MRKVSAVLWAMLWWGAAGAAADAATYDTLVRWSPSAGSAGYHVYVRPASGTYGSPLDAGMPTPGMDGSVSFVVAALDVRTDYLFAVSAYAADGTESVRSNELPLGYAQVAPTVDSDGDGLSDAAEDRNLNRIVDAGETDPFKADTDGDGVGDAQDACNGTPAGEAVAADGCGCSQRSCDDANACTTDSCTAGVCAHVALGDGASCSDGNACNGVETCRGGACVAGPAPVCDDGDPCTTDSCNAVTGCAHAAIPNCHACTTVSECDDGNPCTADVCSGGACHNTPVGNGVSCSDGNLCNGSETCQNGTCVAGTTPSCDDGNACTTDSCNPSTGCAHAPIAGCTACTTAGQCNDGNACTTDTCSGGRCQHANVSDGTSCTDGNACNGLETCRGGSCTAGAALNCDDGNVCTRDACSTSSGCTHTPIAGCTACTTAAQCDDGNACTTDTCSGGQCHHGAASNGTSCSDGNVCNGDEKCRSGSCVAGTPLACDDGNACTTDACDPTGGCTHTAIAGCCLTDADCQDTNACTMNERCDAGRCVSDAVVCTGGPCTDAACDATLGCTTQPKPDGSACAGTDACGTAGVCATGVCQTGGALAVGASTTPSFAITRFVLRPAGKKTFDLTAEGSMEAPAFGDLVPDGVDIELLDDTGAILYGITVPGAAFQSGNANFVYARSRGVPTVPGLRRLQLRQAGPRVDVTLRASVPRSVGASMLAEVAGMQAQAPKPKTISWMMRLGGSCTRNAAVTCPSTRNAIRRCG